MERVIASQLKLHLDSYNLDNHYQSAYKTGHSTETTLMCIKNDMHTSLSKVLLDLSVAFDTIDHSILLSCVPSWFGVSGLMFDWFSSYLADKKQFVKVGDVLFDPADLIYEFVSPCIQLF